MLEYFRTGGPLFVELRRELDVVTRDIGAGDQRIFLVRTCRASVAEFVKLCTATSSKLRSISSPAGGFGNIEMEGNHGLGSEQSCFGMNVRIARADPARLEG